MRQIDAIVVHCTAHPDARSWPIGAKSIRADHIIGRGWNDIGYHYVIRRDGEIECGRMESIQGAHCPPVNATSLGVAWVGLEHPTSEQRTALVKLVRELMHRYGVQIHRVFGHREADPSCGKSCPVIDMVQFRVEIGQ